MLMKIFQKISDITIEHLVSLVPEALWPNVEILAKIIRRKEPA